MPVRILLIAIGGGLGSIARYSLGKAWPDDHHTLPLTTLGINLLGSFLLGVLIVAVTETWTAHPNVRPFLGTGILGGFTTFSTFAVQAQSPSAGVAGLYVLLSVPGGIALAAAGMALMRRVKPRQRRVLDLDPDLP